MLVPSAEGRWVVGLMHLHSHLFARVAFVTLGPLGFKPQTLHCLDRSRNSQSNTFQGRGLDHVRRIRQNSVKPQMRTSISSATINHDV